MLCKSICDTHIYNILSKGTYSVIGLSLNNNETLARWDCSKMAYFLKLYVGLIILSVDSKMIPDSKMFPN